LRLGLVATGTNVRPARRLYDRFSGYRKDFPAQAIFGRIYQRSPQAETEYAFRDHQGNREEGQ